jgi:hypothetical protein
MGPDNRSLRERLGAVWPFVSGAARPAAGLAAAFFDTAFAGPAFLLLAGVFATFFVDLPALDLVLLAAFAGVFFRVAFLEEAFLRAAFLGVAFLFLATFLFDDFLLVTLRFLPLVFLLAGADLRVAAFFLLAAVRFRFLLAVVFAGMLDSCRSEKNAGLYRARLNLEARSGAFSALSAAGSSRIRRPQKRRPEYDVDSADNRRKTGLVRALP